MIRNLLAACVLASCVTPIWGQVVPAPAAQPSATTQADALENPVTFLLIRLASTEESLKAVDNALGQTDTQVKAGSAKVDTAQNANESMDRNGGGPVPWDQFYGRTARGFYVSDFFVSHPIERPTQFDYIYHANREEAKKAQREVDSLKGKIDELKSRQAQLEADRSALWARIAAAMIAQRDISEQPIYQYHLYSESTDKSLPGTASQRADSVEALAQFVRTMDSVMASVDSSVSAHQRQAIEYLKINSDHAQKDLVHAMAGINDPAITQRIHSLMTMAKTLAVVSSSCAEADDLAADARRSGDAIEKSTALGLLQTAWVDITSKLGAMDDQITKLQGDWHISPDTNKPLPSLTLLQAPSMPDAIAPGMQADDVADSAQEANAIDLLAAVHLSEDTDRGHWAQEGSELHSVPGSPDTLRLRYTPQGDYDFKVTFTRVSGDDFVEMMLADGNRHFSWLMGALNNRVAGFVRVDNHTVDHNRSSRQMKIINGKTYTALLRVREHGVAAFVNGERVSSISIDKVKLSPPPITISGDSLGVGAGEEGSVVFHSIQVIPVNAPATLGKL